MKTPNEYIFDKYLQHYVATLNVEYLPIKIREALDEARRAIRDVLDSLPEGPVSREVLDLVEARISAVLEARTRKLAEDLQEELEKLLESNITVQTNVLREALGRGGARRLIEKTISAREILPTIQIAGRTFQETLTKFARDVATKLGMNLREKWSDEFQRAVYRGYTGVEALGVAAQTAGLELTSAEFRKALGRETLERLRRIVGDYTSRGIDVANVRLAQAHKDVIAGFQWVATLDAKVCPACAALDGRRWYFDATGDASIENMPPLPLHPNCRCTKVPILREDIDPHPPSPKTLREWFAELPEEDKRKILGASRYELYKAGVPLPDLVDARGRLRPLDELRALVEKARKRAAEAVYRIGTWNRHDEGESRRRLHKAWEECWGRELLHLARQEQEAVERYQGAGYYIMNRLMAGRPVKGEVGEYQSFCQRLVSLFQRRATKLKRAIRVFRGASETLIPDVLREGLLVRNDAFMSTSLHKGVAESFASGKDKPVVWEIVVPKGAPALLPAICTDLFWDEAEVILPPGAILRVEKITRERGITRVTARVVEVVLP